MVIGADRIDQPLSPALELVEVVGDVGGEVGGLAVGADQDPILVVAEGRGPQPHGALAVVHVAAGPQSLDGALHLARIVERPLREPGVEADAEAVRVRSIRSRIAAVPRLASSSRSAGVRPGGGQLAGQLGDVLASVAVLGRLASLHPGGDRLGEPAHLAADVVEQVLPLDRRARRAPGAGRVSPRTRRPLPLATVSGPVGLAETNSTSTRSGGFGRAGPNSSPASSRRRRLSRCQRSARKTLTKPGPATSMPLGARTEARSELIAEQPGDLPGRLTAGRREQHRGVGRVVAELGLRRALQRGRERLGRRRRGGPRPPSGSPREAPERVGHVAKLLEPATPPRGGWPRPVSCWYATEKRQRRDCGRDGPAGRGVIAAVGGRVSAMVAPWLRGGRPRRRRCGPWSMDGCRSAP